MVRPRALTAEHRPLGANRRPKRRGGCTGESGFTTRGAPTRRYLPPALQRPCVSHLLAVHLNSTATTPAHTLTRRPRRRNRSRPPRRRRGRRHSLSRPTPAGGSPRCRRVRAVSHVGQRGPRLRHQGRDESHLKRFPSKLANKYVTVALLLGPFERPLLSFPLLYVQRSRFIRPRQGRTSATREGGSSVSFMAVTLRYDTRTPTQISRKPPSRILLAFDPVRCRCRCCWLFPLLLLPSS